MEGFSQGSRTLIIMPKSSCDDAENSVLGLDISQDLDDEILEFLGWKWFDVYAFSVGDWMKDVLEMAAHIEASGSNLTLGALV